METSSGRQAVEVGKNHSCGLGEIEVQEIFDFGPELREEEGWSELHIVGALIFLAIVMCSFFVTLAIGLK